MVWLDQQIDKWNQFVHKPRPGMEKAGHTCNKVLLYIKTLWGYIYKLRGVIASIPVATAAIVLAAINHSRLPDAVAVLMPSINKESAEAVLGFLVFTNEHISLGTAVFAPLVLTVGCLLLTCCSNRILYPWLISLLTLALPLFLLVTNVYL